MYKSWLTYSDEGLHNAALTHLFQIASVNEPKSTKSPAAISIHSSTCVRAAPGAEPAFNFASRPVQELVAADVSHIDGLIDTGWSRMEKKNDYPARFVNTYVDLERQVRRFLDNRRGMAALNVDDLKFLLRHD